MKLIRKLFHKMMESLKFQGCSLIYMGMAKDLDVPGLSVTVGTIRFEIPYIPSLCENVISTILSNEH